DLGPAVTGVGLIHCTDGGGLSGQTLDIHANTNLCDLEGGAGGDPRWNDSVCQVQVCTQTTETGGNGIDDNCDGDVDEGCSVSDFSWEASADGVNNWYPVTLPDTNFGCSNCSRFYRTTVTGTPADVTFRFGSDNEAAMFVNGQPAFTDYFVHGNN